MTDLRRGLLAGVAHTVMLAGAATLLGVAQPVALILASVHAALECGSQSAGDRLSRDDVALYSISGISLFLVYLVACVAPAVELVAIPIWLAGIGLRVAAMRTLGRSFRSSSRPVGRRVSHGVYRFLHHPSEVGLALCVVGATIMTQTPQAFILAGFALALMVVRVWVEERQSAASSVSSASRSGRSGTKSTRSPACSIASRVDGPIAATR